MTINADKIVTPGTVFSVVVTGWDNVAITYQNPGVFTVYDNILKVGESQQTHDIYPLNAVKKISLTTTTAQSSSSS